jgi:hypothetical protein
VLGGGARVGSVRFLAPFGGDGIFAVSGVTASRWVESR